MITKHNLLKTLYVSNVVGRSNGTPWQWIIEIWRTFIRCFWQKKILRGLLSKSWVELSCQKYFFIFFGFNIPTLKSNKARTSAFRAKKWKIIGNFLKNTEYQFFAILSTFDLELIGTIVLQELFSPDTFLLRLGYQNILALY